MRNAALDQALATMTTDEKHVAIDSIKIQMSILRDQRARMAELRALIFTGSKAHAQLTAMGKIGRKGILVMLAENVSAYRTELSELDALFAAYATA